MSATSIIYLSAGAVAPAALHDTSGAAFIAQILLMLLSGRLLGELLQRCGQPAVMGQIVAGILIGPSIFGRLFPGLYHLVYTDTIEQKKMIDGIAQIGVLMLIVLTGIETDLQLVKKIKRTAIFSSLGGVLLPFVCGYTLGQFLPESLLPDPGRRFATSLFLATALSISSVKIVAMVIMELDFMRRKVGQAILASAILDDTLAWIIIACIARIAAGQSLGFMDISISLGGAVLFLALSFTFGPRAVALLIRWTNDTFVVELPVITVILILMCALALLTHALGVHTLLGAFVVGVLVGQSPFLTRHIADQIRGLIVAFFMPVFFTLAGQNVDVTSLADPRFLSLELLLVFTASFGKLAGCYCGGRLGELSHAESLALAFGMNARGSTEVIIASIGLSLGVLSRDLYSLIVFMAIATTLPTPLLLRWALLRVPMSREEKERLEREKAQRRAFVPALERVLVAVDGTPSGRLTTVLSGLFVGGSKIISTLLDMSGGHIAAQAEGILKEAAGASSGDRRAARDSSGEIIAKTAKEHPADPSSQLLKELEKGYDMLFLGSDSVFGAGGRERYARAFEEFKGMIAVVRAAPGRPIPAPGGKLQVLIPTAGSESSRRAAEIGISIAKTAGTIPSAVHIVPPVEGTLAFQRLVEDPDPVYGVIRDIADAAKLEGTTVNTFVVRRRSPVSAILKAIHQNKVDLLVLGAQKRAGAKIFFGHTVSRLLEQAPCSILIVAS